MTKKLTKPIAFLSAVAMLMTMLLYLPGSVGFGLTANAQQITAPSTDADGVYQIGTAAELYWFAGLVNGTLSDVDQNKSANAVLTENITVNEELLSAIQISEETGKVSNSENFLSWTPIGWYDYDASYDNSYTGTFDGQGFTVSGLFFEDSKADCVGLFGYVGENGSVSNVGVIDSYFYAYSSVSGVCGENYGKITNCYNEGTVNLKSTYVGGVCGENYGEITSCYNKGTVNGSLDYTDYTGGVCGSNSGTIKNCSNQGKIFGYAEVGGVCGRNYNGTIENCNNSGAVSGSDDHTGGVCGRIYQGDSIKNCFNTGVVSGKNEVGGVCGTIEDGTVEICYNTGAVSGERYVGGVCGNIEDGTLKNCYNTNTVSGDKEVGGVCGYNVYGSATNCYNTGTVSGTSYVGGVCGSLYYEGIITNCYYLNGCNADGTTFDSAKGIGKTLAEFHKGEVVYLLSQGQAGSVWGQDLSDENSFPALNAAKVYVSAPCTKYSNEEFTESVEHDFADGVCSCGTYKISSADELYAFAERVNSGNTSINAVLAADIVVNENVLIDGELNTDNSASFRSWTPIGSNSARYTGTFDGQGHTIKGLYYVDADADDVGFFGWLGESGVAKNVGIVDSYFYAKNTVGGVCGHGYEATITNCYNTGTVIGTGMHVGGVCGHGYEATITNCYNTGNVSGSTGVGGVSGYNVKVSVINCYNTGNVSGSNDVGGVCGDIQGGNIENCYYLAESETDSNSGTTYKTEAQFASGEVCYLLNGSTSKGTLTWGQTLTGDNADSCPVLGGAKVYASAPCPKYYSNEVFTESVEHDFADGVCSSCGVYKISSADELYAFAEKVNSGETSINAVLTTDIVVNENVLIDGELDTNNSASFRSWTPIGYFDYDTGNEYPYTGTFDGQGFTISGLYFNDPDANDVGLFANNLGTIKNVGVVDSYFYGNKYVGGVCGYNDSGTIKNCYNTGAVSGASLVGGVCGINISGTIANSYNTGTVTATGEGASVGGVSSINENGTIVNCYYDSTVFSGNAVGYSVGTVIEIVLGKTATQFNSGEAAYLLSQGCTIGNIVYDGSDWGQDDLGAENSYPVIGGSTVYRNETYPGCIHAPGAASYNYSNENKSAAYATFTEVTDEAVEATCDDTGLTEGSHCSVCGKILVAQQTVPATGAHTYGETVVAPTYAADGYTLHTCSVCGDSYKDAYTAKKTVPKAAISSNYTSTGTTITLNWAKVEGVTGYIVYSYDSANSKWVKAATVEGANTLSTTITDLTPGSVTKFKVNAYVVENGKTYYGATSTFLDAAALANASISPSYTSTGTSITLNWAKADGATGYIVYKYDSASSKWVKAATVEGADTRSTTIADVTPGSVNKFKVNAYVTANGKTYYGKTGAYLDAAAIANAKISSDYSSTGTSFTFSWDKVEGAAGYIVYRYDSASSKWVKAATVEGEDTLTATIADVTPGSVNKFKVNAYVTANGKTYYGKSGASLDAAAIGNASFNSSYTSTKTTVDVSWGKVEGATGYRIYKYDSANRKWVLVKTVTGADTTSATVTGLTSGTTTKLKVNAYLTKGTKTYYGKAGTMLGVKTK